VSFSATEFLLTLFAWPISSDGLYFFRGFVGFKAYKRGVGVCLNLDGFSEGEAGVKDVETDAEGLFHIVFKKRSLPETG
jgi:hypothetical protein